MLYILLRRKIRTFYNTLKALRGWDLVKNLMFAGVGVLMLSALYAGFWRLLNYLETVQLIGPMLSWKLTSMVLLMTFSMVIVSSIIISMTTLYYSSDLKFLFSCPLELRSIFMDKALETVFYSSWTLVLAIFPYVIALGRIKELGAGFYFSYLCLMVPFVMLAGAFGIFFSMIVMYCFPSSRTRDTTWLLGSLSVAFVYVVFRFSKPEKLLRPDSLEVVAQYIQYLQSPTAPYMPSWWVTKAMVAYSASHWASFAASAAVLCLAAGALYALIYFLSGRLYLRGFSGAQGTPRFSGGRGELPEQRLAARFPALLVPLTLYWKDRLLLVRDARYWSQVILIVALIAVYLFSIRQLPLDTPSLKSLVSFLNVAVAGFVMAAIGLRFTFPAIAILIGISSLVPYLGAIVGAVVSSIVAYLQFGTFMPIIKILAFFTGIRFFDDWVLQPYIMKKAVKLNPAIILLALTAGWEIGGIWGVIFSIPVTCIIKEILQIAVELQETEFRWKPKPEPTRISIPYT